MMIRLKYKVLIMVLVDLVVVDARDNFLLPRAPYGGELFWRVSDREDTRR